MLSLPAPGSEIRGRTPPCCLLAESQLLGLWGFVWRTAPSRRQEAETGGREHRRAGLEGDVQTGEEVGEVCGLGHSPRAGVPIS